MHAYGSHSEVRDDISMVMSEIVSMGRKRELLKVRIFHAKKLSLFFISEKNLAFSTESAAPCVVWELQRERICALSTTPTGGMI